MRQRVKAIAKTAITTNPHIVKDICKLKFTNQGKKVMELAMGKGQFINSLAIKNPDTQYIGVDIKEERCLSCAKKIASNNLTNLQIVCQNILTPDLQPQFLVDELWITFPDPWPKKRHHKRRLLSSFSINNILNLIKDDGKLYFKTDHFGLYEDTLNLLKTINLADFQIKLEFTTINLHQSRFPIKDTTEFEDKYLKAGKPIYLIFSSIRRNP